MARPVLIVLLGSFAAAWSAVFIKMSGTHPVLLTSYRLLLAAAILTPIYLKESSRRNRPVNPAVFKPAILPGIFLTLHFITWIVGVRLTYIANASMIVNMVPAAMPFFAFFIAKERVNRTEIIGTLFTLFGAVLLVGADFRVSFDSFVGDLLAFLSMLFYTAYLALAKVKNKSPSIWLYVVPLYYWAGILCLAVSFFLQPPWAERPTFTDIGAVIGLAVVCTVGAHSILNYGMKSLRGQLVSLLALTEAPWAMVIAFLLFDENPPFVFLPAAICIGAGIVTALRGSGLRGVTRPKDARDKL